MTFAFKYDSTNLSYHYTKVPRSPNPSSLNILNFQRLTGQKPGPWRRRGAATRPGIERVAAELLGEGLRLTPRGWGLRRISSSKLRQSVGRPHWLLPNPAVANEALRGRGAKTQLTTKQRKQFSAFDLFVVQQKVLVTQDEKPSDKRKANHPSALTSWSSRASKSFWVCHRHSMMACLRSVTWTCHRRTERGGTGRESSPGACSGGAGASSGLAAHLRELDHGFDVTQVVKDGRQHAQKRVTADRNP